MSPTLPILDMSGFRADPASLAGRQFVEDLREACHGPGFVYLRGHGVDDRLMESAMLHARKFFALPAEDREALAIGTSAAFRGYTIIGDERTKGRTDWREQLDIGPEQEAPTMEPGDPEWRKLRGPNQWPHRLPEMKPATLEWSAAMEQVGICAMRALALGLGQPIDFFDDGYLPESDFHVKIIRYPPQRESADTGQGVGLHHDSGLLTFIHQDELGGLQVELDGQLVEVPLVPGALVMNLGEMLQSATGGYLRATAHRVDSPPPGKERISLAYFFNPRFETVFEPIPLPPELIAEAPGGENEWANDPIHSVFGDNNLKIRLRSHPDVARNHY